VRYKQNIAVEKKIKNAEELSHFLSSFLLNSEYATPTPLMSLCQRIYTQPDDDNDAFCNYLTDIVYAKLTQ
jgi:hypothetical protein